MIKTDPAQAYNALSEINSTKFRFWSFVSMLLLVFVHGYNLNRRFLQPFTVPEEPFTFTAFIEYLLANGLLRFRIPMLFMVSGFLFALHDGRNSHFQRVRRRVRTLLVPYVFWSGFTLLLVLALEQIPFWREIIASTQLLRIDETRFFLSEHTFPEILARLTVATPAYQLWFLRSLFIYNVLFPLLRRVVTHKTGSRIFFGFAVLFWVMPMNILFIEGEGLLFFSLGIWIQKKGFDLDVRVPWMPLSGWFGVFAGISVIKTVLAFQGRPLLGPWLEPALLLSHKAVVFAGLVFAWYSSTALAKRCMQWKWFSGLSDFSFVIYAAHAPFVAFAIEALLKLGGGHPAIRLAGFFLLPLALVAASIALGWGLRRFLPGLYSLMTGGRGLGE